MSAMGAMFDLKCYNYLPNIGVHTYLVEELVYKLKNPTMYITYIAAVCS